MMQRILWATGFVVVCMSACSGGTDSGPLAGPGPAFKEPPETPREGDSGTFDIPGNIPGPGVTVGPGPGSGGNGGNGGTGGSPNCLTCADVYDQGLGAGTICSASTTVVSDFATCISNFCSAECSEIATSGVDADCDTCLTTNCNTERTNCLSDS